MKYNYIEWEIESVAKRGRPKIHKITVDQRTNYSEYQRQYYLKCTKPFNQKKKRRKN